MRHEKNGQQKSDESSVSKSEHTLVTAATAPHIEMISNLEMTVEGCKGVAEYTDEFLRLDLTDGILMLFGADLRIAMFDGTVLVVRGSITSLEFCK